MTSSVKAQIYRYQIPLNYLGDSKNSESKSSDDEGAKTINHFHYVNEDNAA